MPLVDALVPFAPFGRPVTPPVPGPFDSPTVTLCCNETWMTYLIGAAQVLMAAATWDSTDPVVVHATIGDARDLIDAMMELTPCAMPLQFRINPTDGHFWDYSVDNGVNWTRQPNTVVNWLPTFPVDAGSPTGFDLSVNGGLSSAQVPSMAQADPNAVITDPSTLLRNLISAGAGADGLMINALATLGVALLQTNGIAAYFAKIPGLGVAANAVVQIKAGTDYTYPLLEVP